ncbi:MAG: lipopolysaccharide biosynthesis protein [Formivibrio sp.]|nr:lipopolysaccharide biosynthesis protein [Formivibrio sp.]
MQATEASANRTLAARGAVFFGSVQLYRAGLSVISAVLLARLLRPADFGVVAVASSCAGFVTVIQDLGLNQPTIQRQVISLAQVNALFWLSAGFSLFLALLLAGCAPIVSWFFGDPRLTALTAGFAVLIIFGGAQSQQLALLNRAMRFKALAWIDTMSATFSVAAALLVAWLTSSYWSLFAAGLVSALVSLVCVWSVCSFRFARPSFEGKFHEIFRFGAGAAGFSILGYLGRTADNLLIGRYYGSEQLGLYDRAYRLLVFPLIQIQYPIARVVYPILCRLQSEPERYRKAYKESVSLLMMAAHPGLIFAIVFAESIFSILLGPQWTPAIPIFHWLGIAGLPQFIWVTGGWLLLSQGRGGDYFKMGLFISIASVASFVAGLPWGSVGVAAAYAVTNYLILTPGMWWITGRSGPVTVRDHISNALPHAVAAAISAVVLVGARIVLSSPDVFGCLGLAILSYAVYGAIMMLFPNKRLILGESLRTFARIFPLWR